MDQKAGLILLLGLIIPVLACERRDLSYQDINFQIRSLTRSDLVGPQVPREIVEYIRSQSTSPLSRKVFPLNLYIYPLASGVISGPTQWVIPYGYGELDLASVVTQRRGSFRLLLEPELKASELKKLKVLFWPQTKSQGCSAFYEVTAGFRHQWMTGGVELEFEDLQYLEFLGGVLFFLVVEEGELKFSSVRIFDSRYPDIFCDGQGENI